MNRTRTLLMICAVGVWTCTDLLGAQRTFVSAAVGDDANSCTRAFPCRNFSAALLQTDPDGEVIVLDSGGYGVVTVTQPVSLISPKGVYAGITAFAGTAITINAGDSAHVVLRNLSLNSQGANYGIRVPSAAALYIEHCTVSGFGNLGINFDESISTGRLHVTDTTVRRCGGSGIAVGGNVLATIDSVLLHHNGNGVLASNGAEANIRKTTSGPGVGDAVGFTALSGARMVIQSSVATGNGFGFLASGASVMTIVRSAANANTFSGVRADDSGTTIYVSDSVITANGAGVEAETGGVITSRLNNTVQTNTDNGSFSSTFTPN
jgi:parallel beta helix pectate lyase-like protein